MIDKNYIRLIIKQFYGESYYNIGKTYTTVYLDKKQINIYYTQQNWFGKVHIDKLRLAYPLSLKNSYVMRISIHIDLFLIKKRQINLNYLLND